VKEQEIARESSTTHPCNIMVHMQVLEELEQQVDGAQRRSERVVEEAKVKMEEVIPCCKFKLGCAYA